MAAVKKTTKQNGYGEKQTVRIITVDKEKRRVECAMRDGAMIFAAIWETGTIFRWPEVGEIWTVRMDTGIWRLDQIVQSVIAEHESEATPKTLADLPEGDTRIIGGTVHANDIDAKDLTVNTIIATSGLYTDYGIVTSLPITTVKGSLCTFKAATGIYWRLIYTGEATYPWAKVGGPALMEQTTTGVEIKTESETPQSGVNAPKIAVPLNLEALITYGSNRAIPPNASFSRLALFFGEVEQESIYAAGSSGIQDNMIAKWRGVVTKSTVVQNRYARLAGVGNIGFIGIYIEVDPLRVG